MLSGPAVRALKVGEAREACSARGLATTGLKAELVARLLTHEALRQQTAAGGDTEDGDNEAAESYDLKKIHAMNLTDGALEYEVRPLLFAYL